MDALKNNYNFTSNSPELKRRLESQENFSALNKDKMVQDTTEFAKNQIEDFKKENFVFRILRNLGVKDPKKAVKSAVLTIATVAGVAFLGNMLAKPSFKLGNKIDDFLLNKDNFISKGYRSIANFFSTKKANLAKKMSESNSKTIRTFYETFTKKKLGPINSYAKTYPSGGTGIFSMTPPSVLETGLRSGSSLDDVEKLVGNALKPSRGWFLRSFRAKRAAKQLTSIFFDPRSSVDKFIDDARKLKVPEDSINQMLSKLKSASGKMAENSDVLTANSDFLAKVLKGANLPDEIIKVLLPVGENAGRYASGNEIVIKMLRDANVSEDKITEIIKRLTGSKNYVSGTLNKLFDDDTAKSVLDKLFVSGNNDNIEICRQMANGLRGINPNDKDAVFKFLSQDLADARSLEKLRKNGINISDETIKAFESITNVNMNKGGPFTSWWPVNILNKAFGKVAKAMGKEWKGFARGNYGNAMLKFEAMDGTLAKTLPGRIVQKSVIFPTEYISNFVNDKSGFGVFLCASLLSLYNTAQDAPKDKKIPTVANNFASTIGSVALSMPLAAGIAYNTATLKGLDWNVFTAIPKVLGSVVGLGLKSEGGKVVPSGSFLARTLGGALRLVLVMKFIMPKVSKVVNDGIAKIFGKPYDPDEEKRKKMLEEAQNQVIPELGITQKEFLEKAQAHPEVMQRLQTDSLFQREVNANPQVLLDLFDGKEPNIKPKDKLVSPANRNFLSGTSKVSTTLDKKPEDTKTKQQNSSLDTATYIPSSDFIAQHEVDDSQSDEIKRVLENADKALKRAEKYL